MKNLFSNKIKEYIFNQYRNHKIKAILIGLIIIFIFYSYIPLGYGRVLRQKDKIPMSNVYVTIQYRGDTYKAHMPMGHGRRQICVDATVVKTNQNGYYIIPGLPFYRSLQYIKKSVNLNTYKKGYKQNSKYYPHKYREQGGDIYLKNYIHDPDNYLEVLLETGQYDLCGKPFWNETSKSFYRELYLEAKMVAQYSASLRRFQIPRKICNIAIGDPLNEPRADECPWLTE